LSHRFLFLKEKVLRILNLQTKGCALIVIEANDIFVSHVASSGTPESGEMAAALLPLPFQKRGAQGWRCLFTAIS